MGKIPVHDLTDALFDLTDFFWGMDFWGWEWIFGVGNGILESGVVSYELWVSGCEL